MARRKRWIRLGAALAVLALAGVWIAGELTLHRANPPLRYDGVILSPQADVVLKRACFDCHSNETRFPAYSYLPIASLLLADHVNEGREAGNFSEWGQMTPDDRKDSIEDTIEEIEKGRMPLPSYLWLHPEARLSEADRALLRDAALQAYGVRPDGKKQVGEREGRERH